MKFNWIMFCMTLTYILLVILSTYFSYCYIANVGFGIPYLKIPDYSHSKFVIKFLLSPIGGILTIIICLLCLLSFVLYKVGERKEKIEEKIRRENLMNEIMSKHKRKHKLKRK